MSIQNDIGTGAIRLTDYLPPTAVVWEWTIGAVVAFVVVQMWKSHLRSRELPPQTRRRGLSRIEMSMYTIAIAAAANILNLAVLHEYVPAKAVVYGLQGGILAPLVITALLAALEVFAPTMRHKLSQDRRERNQASPGQDRRDDTTRFL